MADNVRKNNDSYDELLKSFYSNTHEEKPGDDVKNRGEIYFSANGGNRGNSSAAQRGQRPAQPQVKRTGASAGNVTLIGNVAVENRTHNAFATGVG